MSFVTLSNSPRVSELYGSSEVTTALDRQTSDRAPRGVQALAELKTPDGTFLIQERRQRPRDEGDVRPKQAPVTYSSSPQMMALGGLIIIGVLVASYTTKYDLAVGHVGGALPIPAVGYLALQLYLARAAYRLYCDIHLFARIKDYLQSRLLRYLPAVIPAVLLGYGIIHLVGCPGAQASLASLPANLVMMADMVGGHDIDASHWRLKIEMIQSALVAMAWFGPMRRHLAALLATGLAFTAFCIVGEPARNNLLTLQGFITSDGYLPLFVYGVALHQLTQDRTAMKWQIMLAASAALTAVSNTPLHGAVVVASLLVLRLIAMGHLQSLGRVPGLARLGAIAFPIYVVHFVLGFTMIHRLEAAHCPSWLAILVTSAVAIGLGKAFNLAFERPAERHVPGLVARISAKAAKTIVPLIDLVPAMQPALIRVRSRRAAEFGTSA